MWSPSALSALFTVGSESKPCKNKQEGADHAVLTPSWSWTSLGLPFRKPN